MSVHQLYPPAVRIADPLAQPEPVHPPVSHFRMKRRAALMDARMARLQYRLADSAMREALRQLLKAQDELADLRRRYYAPEPAICWADRIDFRSER